ncbi:MAG: exodeoxyribonuclease VII large subunit [Acidobacteria bacterium]|nr:exodeoxyribonuclease VII large subunit [Acidobacteriota bacterium]
MDGAAPGHAVLSVSQLVRLINVDLGSRYGTVAVEGEISNFTRSGAGHLYFTIKDRDAQLSVVMFAREAQALKFAPEQGLAVVVRGRLGIYAQRGSFQLNAIAVEPVGLGALQLAFEQLRKRLSEEGLFDSARKLPIPMLPSRIVVVTSPVGAAIRDVLNVLGRRFRGIHIQIYPVRVQGEAAAAEIAAAIRHLSTWKRHDVILLCRGGGSLEDLWAFNEEVVARAIADCTIPTISGIGHEVDFTIADFVADVRAATPSAAAELVVGTREEIQLRIDHARRRIEHVVTRRMGSLRRTVDSLSLEGRLGSFPLRIRAISSRLQRRQASLYTLLEKEARTLRARLARLDRPLTEWPSRVALREKCGRVDHLTERLSTRIRIVASRRQQAVAALVATLEAVSPLSVLARGYALAFTSREGRRKILKGPEEVEIGEQITVQLSRGSLDCAVEGKTLGVEAVMPAAEPGIDRAGRRRGARKRNKGERSIQQKLPIGER